MDTKVIQEPNGQKNAQYLSKQLNLAIQLNTIQLIDFWVKQGANVNHENQTGQTPLSLALLYRDHAIIRKLLAYGADPHKKNNKGTTPYQYAQQMGDANILKLFDNQDVLKLHVQISHSERVDFNMQKYVINQVLLLVSSQPDLISAHIARIESYLAKEERRYTFGDAIRPLNELMPLLVQPERLISGQTKQSLIQAQLLSMEHVGLKPFIELIKRIEKCYVLLPTELAYQPILVSLRVILDEYKHFLSQLLDSTPQSRQALLATKVLLSGSRIGYYKLDQKVGRELVCRDFFGLVQKKNAFGNHPVCALNGVHYKPNPEGKDFIEPSMEKAMVDFYQIISGERVVCAPTTMIKIDGLPITEIPGSFDAGEVFTKNPDMKKAYDEFSGLLHGGKSAQEIFQNNNALYQRLYKVPGSIGRVIQAGYTITGTSLKTFLDIKLVIQYLKEVFANNALDVFKHIFNGVPYQKLLQVSPALNNVNDLNVIIQAYTQFLLKFNPENRPVEFKTIEKMDPKERYMRFRYLASGRKLDLFVRSLAIMSGFPPLMRGRSIHEIFEIPSAFKHMKNLMPNQPPQVVFQTAPFLLNLLDHENFSKIFVGSLLTNPSDGKSDNYMCRLTRDNNGQITKIEIIGIDNDKGLAYSLSQNPRTKEHYVDVKCIIFLFSHMMHKTLHPSVAKFLSERPAELIILDWLELLIKNNGINSELIDRKTLTQADLVDESSEKALDIPFYLEPTAVPTLYAKISKAQKIIRANRQVSHQALLKALESIIEAYYTAILKRTAGSQGEALRIIHKGELTVEAVLAERLEQPWEGQETLTQALAPYTSKPGTYEDNRTQSIEEATQIFVKLIKLENAQENLRFQILNTLGKSFGFIQDLNVPQQILNQWLHRAVNLTQPYAVKIILNAGADVNYQDQAGRTVLMLFAKSCSMQGRSVPHLLLLLDVLLEQENIDLDLHDKVGYCALFNLVSAGLTAPALARRVLKKLVDRHIDLHNKDYSKYVVALDKTIDRNVPVMFADLVHYGAGRGVNLQKALGFIEKNKNLSVMQGVFEKLKHQNAWVHWQHMLNETLIQSNPSQQKTSGKVVVHGSHSGWVELPRELAAKLINPKLGRFIRTMNETKYLELSEEERNNPDLAPEFYGRRTVIGTTHNGHSMHWKQDPEMPGMEYAVSAFARVLLGHGTPANELFKFWDKKGKPYPVLVSQTILGENMQDILADVKKEDAILPLLDKKYFSEMIVFSMLINPEDGKPDNYMVVPFEVDGEARYRIVGIDNDHAFVDPVVRSGRGRRLQVKCILFCLDQMKDDYIHEDVVKMFINLDPYQVLTEWLTKLTDAQDRFHSLFTPDEQKILFKRPSLFAFKADRRFPIIIPIPFSRGETKKLYEKMMRLKKIFQKTPKITGLELLTALMPDLGVRYQQAFDARTNPGMRFGHLSSELYSRAIAGRFGTLSSGADLLKSRRIPEKTVLSAREGKTFGPREALKELQLTHQMLNTLEQTRKAVMHGSLTQFKKLPIDDYREEIINKLDFGLLSRSVQKSILSSLSEGNFFRLSLRNCSELTMKHLKTILSKSPMLEALDLSGCKQVDDTIGLLLEEHCKGIKRLNLSGIPKLTRLSNKGIISNVKTLKFPSLRNLWINAQLHGEQTGVTMGLEIVHIDAPQLEIFESNGCTDLNHLVIRRAKLKRLCLNQCTKLESHFVEEVVVRSLDLKVFRAADCRNIRFPKLMRYMHTHKLLTPDNIAAITQDGDLNLMGLAVTDSELLTISKLAQSLKTINLHGCQYITWRGIAALMENCPELAKITMTENRAMPKAVSSMTKVSAETLYHVSPAGNDKVICGLYDKNKPMALMDTKKSKPISNQFNPVGKNAPSWVWCTAVLPNGLILTGSEHGLVNLWHYDENNKRGQWVHTFRGHLGSVYALAVESNDVFYTGSEDGTVKKWRVSLKKCVQTNKGHSKAISSVAVVGKDRLVSASWDNTLCVWDTLNGKRLQILKGHNDVINCVVKLRENVFASGSNDGTIKIWALGADQAVTTIMTSNPVNPVLSIVPLPNDKFVSGHKNGQIKVWDSRTYTCIEELEKHGGHVPSLVVMPDASLVSAGNDKIIKRWEFAYKNIDITFRASLRTHFDVINDDQNTVTLRLHNNAFNDQTRPAMLTEIVGFVTTLFGVKTASIVTDSKRGLLRFKSRSADVIQNISMLLSALKVKQRVTWNAYKPGFKNNATQHRGSYTQGYNPRQQNFFNKPRVGSSPTPRLSNSNTQDNRMTYG